MAVDLLTRVTAADRPAMTGQSGSGAEVETVTGTVTTLLLGLS